MNLHLTPNWTGHADSGADATASHRINLEQTLRFVIVDDNPEFLGTASRTLEQVQGLELVGSGRSGAEAGELAGRLRPHLILMDLCMPGVNGLEATREIKACFPEITVLLMSLFGGSALKRAALNAGADNFFQKSEFHKITDLMQLHCNLVNMIEKGPTPEVARNGGISKMRTGIEGLDEITGGGLPRHRNTLVIAGPGSGKTVFGLQTLVNGARLHDEPGIFVAFEERVKNIVENAGTFGWNLPALEKEKLFLLDVHLRPEVVQCGDFELTGMLASIGAKAKEIKAKRIVFDSVDVLISLLNDPVKERKEIFRLHDWLLESGLTAIITAKRENENGFGLRYGFLPFMADCVIELQHCYTDHVSLRSCRVAKYRGSNFSENEAPMVIGHSGIEITSISAGEPEYVASTERVSTGVQRLDTMLGGGYFRGASILIAGSPGTAKSTLSGAFIEATCKRGERAMYVSFDESAPEIVRNLRSVGIQLTPHVASGLLRMVSTRSEAISAKEHLVRLSGIIREHRPSCLVIDPLSSLLKAGGPLAAHGVVERLLHLTKSEGITVIFTSLLNGSSPHTEASLIEVSTVADTWIQLSYALKGGERNRALTIVKSRGTSHSNQVRELLLSEAGVTLTDVYAAGGEILMGTSRWEQEQKKVLETERLQEEITRKRMEVELSQAKLDAQIEAFRRDLAMQRAELEAAVREQQRRSQQSEHQAELMRRRGVDFQASNAIPDTNT
ncbi:MAG: circadian clock protein KaiC [Verrucomicrobiales bacterium]